MTRAMKKLDVETVALPRLTAGAIEDVRTY